MEGSPSRRADADAEPATVRTWKAVCDARAEALAAAAVALARKGASVAAQRAASDAVACLPTVGPMHAFRVRVLLGEASLLLGRSEAACAHLEAAVHLCHAIGDERAAAGARFAFGCARLHRRLDVEGVEAHSGGDESADLWAEGARARPSPG